MAALIEPGRWKLPEISRRAVVSVVIASLHALAIYLLATVMSSGNYRQLDASVMEIEVLAADRQLPKPPSFPPLMLVASRPIDPPVSIVIDVPVDPVPVSHSIDTRDLGDHTTPVAATTASAFDTFPVLRPRPISGPNGANRYPNASIIAKESGTVVMNICVSMRGRVDSVQVAHSSGFPRLDHVALGIAAEYRFQPATRQGHPVAACAPYQIAFEVR